ncbi:17.7g4 protein [Bracoviriform inaniti]|uniref:17.7g4 protein n=1 Tax=Bracoviriform inaniti TaxID=36344 RepID=A8E106_9VIRU|nr:17.7g4 protein [Bracoviriform inaniti]CAO98976.1 17.7g4 protein [Bracoviriform inaniti]
MNPRTGFYPIAQCWATLTLVTLQVLWLFFSSGSLCIWDKKWFKMPCGGWLNYLGVFSYELKYSKV